MIDLAPSLHEKGSLRKIGKIALEVILGELGDRYAIRSTEIPGKRFSIVVLEEENSHRTIAGMTIAESPYSEKCWYTVTIFDASSEAVIEAIGIVLLKIANSHSSRHPRWFPNTSLAQLEKSAETERSMRCGNTR